jgi:hypothetical protein
MHWEQRWATEMCQYICPMAERTAADKSSSSSSSSGANAGKIRGLETSTSRSIPASNAFVRLSLQMQAESCGEMAAVLQQTNTRVSCRLTESERMVEKNG